MVAEIQAALPQLSTRELLQIEQSLHAIYRQRQEGIIYDDAYGTVTEADLINSAEEAFLAYDNSPALEAWLLEAAGQPATPLTHDDFEAMRRRVSEKTSKRT